MRLLPQIHAWPTVLSLCAGVVAAGGCVDKVGKANVELRKQNQELVSEVADLKRQRDADQAAIRVADAKQGTVSSLPAETLARLFTVAGIKLNRLTGGFDADPARTGDEAIKVYVVPTDQTGDELKAAGAFVVEAFDLAAGSSNRVGRWEFGSDQARANWFGSALLYEYVLTCPLDRPVQHDQITLKVTFTDELTQRVFAAQQIITVKPG